MYLSTIVASFLLIVGSALATDVNRRSPQYGSDMSSKAVSSSASNPTVASSSGSVVVHVVSVGDANGALTFFPNDIKAAAGDMVQFQFYPKNHSVVQSNFANPCIPIQSSNSSVKNAFFSGFMPITDPSTAGKVAYTIQVPDTKPIWFYCSQGKHCQGGMVGAINAPATGNTLQAYTEKAKQAPANLSPGQSASGGSATTLATAGTSGATQAASSTGSSPAQQTANEASGLLFNGSKEGLFGAVLAGFVALFVL